MMNAFWGLYFKQLLGCLWKNILLLSRSKKTLLICMMIPSACMLILGAIKQSLLNQNPPLNGQIKRMTDHLNTKPVLFYYPATEFANKVIDGVAASQGMTKSSRVAVMNIVACSTEQEFHNKLLKGATIDKDVYIAIGVKFDDTFSIRNSTYYHVFATEPGWSYTSPAIDRVYEWQSSYQLSSPHLISLQLSIDAAIIDYAAATVSASDRTKTEIRLQAKPLTSLNPGYFYAQPAYSQQVNIDQDALILKVLTSIGYIPLSIFAFQTIVGEKQRGLLTQFRRIGGFESVYWLSLLLVYTLVIILTSMFVVIARSIVLSFVNFPALSRSTSAVIFHLDIPFGMSMISIYVLAASLVQRPAFANTAIVLLLASHVILVSLFSIPFFANMSSYESYDLSIPLKTIIYGSYFDKPTDKSSPFEQFISFFLPWFKHAQGWGAVSRLTFGNGTIPGFFTAADITRAYGPFKEVSAFSPSEPLSQTLLYSKSLSVISWELVACVIIYYVLTWYLSQVLHGDGIVKRSLLFPFDPEYYGVVTQKQVLYEGDTLAELKRESAEQQSIVVHKLSKAYAQIQALKEFSLKLTKNKIHGILGTNGSAKTTLINVLTGKFEPTHGNAFILGMDIRKEMQSIQKYVGICTQEDVLWDNLTGAEHVYFYALCRGHIVDNMFINEKLSIVGLQDARDKTTAQYSGGMKRRLSLLLATVCNEGVKIMYLDEPTTGVDPLNKRYSWDLIKRLKKDRIVVLTTHSMEEADFLSDNIAILYNGKLRAHGTSLFLKSQFGSGYQLSIVQTGKSNDPDQLIKTVKTYIPDAEILRNTPTSLLVGIKRKSVKHLPSLLRKLEMDEEASGAGTATTHREWGVSYTTLEQVFLKLCESETNNALGARFEKDDEKMAFCSICSKRKAEPVTLFSKTGLSFTVKDVVCRSCAEGTPTEPEVTQKLPELIFQQEDETRRIRAPAALGNAASVAALIQEPRRIQMAQLKGGSLSDQVGAVFYKNFRLQIKQRKTNICVILGALVALILIPLIELQTRAAGISNTSERLCPQGYKNFTYVDMSLYGGMYSFAPVSSFDACDESQVSTWFNNYTFGCSRNMTEQVLRNPSIISNGLYDSTTGSLLRYRCLSTDFDTRSLSSGISPFERCDTATSTLYYDRGSCSSLTGDILKHRIFYKDDFARTSFSNLLTRRRNILQLSDIYLSLNRTTRDIDEDFVLLQKKTKNYIGGACQSFALNSAPTEADALNTLLTNVPVFGLDFKDLDSNSRFVDLTVLYHTKGAQDIVTRFETSVFSIDSSNMTRCMYYTVKSGFYSTESPLYMTASSISNLLFRQVVGSSDVSIQKSFYSFGYPQDAALTSMQEFRTSYSSSSYGFVGMIVILALMIGTFSWFPFFSFTLVMEKQTNLFHMMRIQGLRMWSYWLGNYLWYQMLCSTVNLIYFVLIYGLPVGNFLSVNPVWTLLTFILWSHAQVSLSVLLAVIVRRARILFMVAFLFALGCSLAIPFALFMTSAQAAAISPSSGFFPPIAFAHCIYMLNNGIADDRFQEQLWVYLLVMPTVYLLVGIYIHAVTTWSSSSSGGGGGKGVTSDATGDASLDLLFFLPGKYRTPIYKSINNFKSFIYSLVRRRVETNEKKDGFKAIDDDVVLEECKILEMNDKSNPMALKVVHLKKSYQQPDGSSKTVVRDLTFGIEYGEFFGLLGPNGAGKTSLLNILTGAAEADDGHVEIVGQKLDDIGLIYKYIGICPQFDVVWSDLTVKEHLEFYAKIRGCTSSQLNGLVRKAAESVELDGDGFMLKAGTLSGGMRRRLSIAIAMIGDCPILLLDEPSTGLDVSSRAQVWRTIDSLKKKGNHAVIITTHSMEEAEALSTRIGIMAKGGFKCIGSPQHLKNKFGDGYSLYFRVHIFAKIAGADATDGEFKEAELLCLKDLSEYVVANLGQSARLVSQHITSDSELLDMHSVEASRTAPNYYQITAASKNFRAVSWVINAYFRFGSSQGVKLADIFQNAEKLVDQKKTEEELSGLVRKPVVFSVLEWGIHQASLEDVFIRVAKENI